MPAEFGIRVAYRSGEDEILIRVERPGRFQVDRGAERAFFDVGRRCLAGRQRRKDFRRKDVEVEAASEGGDATAAVDVRGTALRRALDSVQAHAREAWAKAADRDVTAFAAVAAGQHHAGNALHGFGKVRIREFADVFRDNAVDRRGFVSLHIDCSRQARAITGDRDRFHCFLCGSRDTNEEQRCCDRRQRHTTF